MHMASHPRPAPRMAGLVLTWRRREPAVRLLRLFALSYMAAVLLFFVTARYRMPAIPVLLIFAAWTCRQLVIDWRGGRYRSFAALGGAVAVLTVVLNLPAATVPEDDAQLHFDLGEVYLRKGEYQRSAQNSLAALELTSGQYNYARHNLAVAYFPTPSPEQYRERWGVSLPCSGWERVVPPRSNHQEN